MLGVLGVLMVAKPRIEISVSSGEFARPLVESRGAWSVVPCLTTASSLKAVWIRLSHVRNLR